MDRVSPVGSLLTLAIDKYIRIMHTYLHENNTQHRGRHVGEGLSPYRGAGEDSVGTDGFAEFDRS